MRADYLLPEWFPTPKGIELGSSDEGSAVHGTKACRTIAARTLEVEIPTVRSERPVQV